MDKKASNSQVGFNPTWCLDESGDLEQCRRLPGQYGNGHGRLDSDDEDDARHLLECAIAASRNQPDNARYRIHTTLPSQRTVIARGQRIQTTQQVLHVLREIPTKIPKLNHPSLGYPQAIIRLLMNPALQKGGLVLLAGPGGSGKSTTIASTVVSRLSALGGVAFTVEDPPEYPLNGAHGKGICFQFDTQNDDSAFPERIKDALRGYPAGGTHSIMMIGEIRSPEVAALAIEAGMSGHLVLATIHGMNLSSSLSRLVLLAGQIQSAENARQDLAECFRLAIHQRLVHNPPEGIQYRAQVLHQAEESAIIRSKIRDGSFILLNQDIDRQNRSLLQKGWTG